MKLFVCIMDYGWHIITYRQLFCHNRLVQPIVDYIFSESIMLIFLDAFHWLKVGVGGCSSCPHCRAHLQCSWLWCKCGIDGHSVGVIFLVPTSGSSLVILKLWVGYQPINYVNDYMLMDWLCAIFEKMLKTILTKMLMRSWM